MLTPIVPIVATMPKRLNKIHKPPTNKPKLGTSLLRVKQVEEKLKTEINKSIQSIKDKLTTRY